MDELPPDVPHDELLAGAAYTERLAYFEKKAQKMRARSDLFMFVGHGCALKVKNDALCLQQGSTHGEAREPILLHRGVHSLKQIAFLSTSGFITLEALRWCGSQGLSILMIDEMGNLIYSLSPENASSVQLRRLQYQACDAELSVSIAREIIRQKIETQIAVLKVLPSHPVIDENIVIVHGQKVMLTEKVGEVDYGGFIWTPFEDGLAELSSMKDIGSMRLFEARLARTYWSAFVGLSIRWQSKDRKIVPLHWKRVIGRFSSSSSGRAARSAINPFHAALNYMYAVTEHQLLCTIHVEGLDPACGFLHADSESRLSLVFDLIEPLRAAVDWRVFSFFKRETFSRGDFSIASDGRVMFNPELLRYIVASCKLDDSVVDGVVSWFREYLLDLGG